MSDLDQILARLKQLHPKLIDLSLGRLERLLARLGHPERRLPPAVHIAGTNGKGSVTAYLKAMLEAAGRPPHVYTSPHLVRFAERIVLGGGKGPARPVPDEALARLLARVEAANTGDTITFFEITTAAAFLAFAETPASALLLEVGLGGRLDATNVVARPAATVITSISIDHADKLGGTLALIAAEKAGIIKPGVPVIVAPQPPEVAEVIERVAAETRAPLVRSGQEWDAFAQNGRLVFQRDDRLLDLPLPALVGPHQVINAGVAVATALATPALGLDERAIARGLAQVQWPARMQRIGDGPLPDLLGKQHELWLDGGHNPAGGIALAQTVADLEERSARPLWLVCGMMGQKDVTGFLTPFRGLAQRLIAVAIPGAHEAPLPPADLARIARGLGLEAEAAASVPEALARIRTQATEPLRVLVCGSLYLAGHVLALQEGQSPQSN